MTKRFLIITFRFTYIIYPKFYKRRTTKKNLLPSSCLKPLTKDDDITYEDIFPIETLII